MRFDRRSLFTTGAAAFAFGGLARHGDGTFGQLFHRLHREVRGRGAGRLLADKDAQANFFAFGALDVFQRAQADLHAGRGIGHIDGIGGVGACFQSTGNKVGGAVPRLINGQHPLRLGVWPQRLKPKRRPLPSPVPPTVRQSGWSGTWQAHRCHPPRAVRRPAK